MNLGKQIFSYSTINIINAAVPFILLPILTHYLQPEDYALLSLTQLLLTLSLPFVLLNLQGLFVIEYSKLTLQDFRSLVHTIIWLPLLGFIFLEIIFIIFQDELSSLFKIPNEWIVLIPIFALMQSIPTLIPALFQAQKNVINFGKYKIALSLTNLLFSVFFIVGISKGLEGRLYGLFIAYSIFTVIGIYIFYKKQIFSSPLSLKKMNSSLKYGLALIPHTLSGILLTMSDRIFIANMIDKKAVGIYSVSFQVAMGVAIIMGSINQAWVPHLFEKLNSLPSTEEKKEIVKLTYLIMFVMLLISVAFIMLTPYIYHFFIAESYSKGIHLSKLLVIAFLFQGFYFMFANYMFYQKKNLFLSLQTFFALILLLILNYKFIPMYGIDSVAYSLITVTLVMFLSSWVVSIKTYKMPWLS